MIRVVVSLVALVQPLAAADPPELGWLRVIGGPGNDLASSARFDSNGNIVLVGYFSGTVDFDPGPGEAMATAAGLSDIFVLKLDTHGDLLWFRTAGGPLVEHAHAMDLDFDDNIYVTGTFQGAADFDPGPGTHMLTCLAQRDSYILRLDSTGNIGWVMHLPSTESIVASRLELVDDSGIVAAGVFRRTVDFDPGPANFNLTSYPGLSAFAVKLDLDGNFEWARAVITTNFMILQDATTDSAGNLYMAGNYTGTVDLDPGPGVEEHSTTGISEAFIVRLDTAGDFVWGYAMQGISDCLGVITTPSGRLYQAGSYLESADFDPGPDVAMLNPEVDGSAYLTCWDQNGNFLWARAFGFPAENASAYDLASDHAGNVYVGGFFEGMADFDPGPGIATLESYGGVDAYLLKLNSDGEFILAQSVGGADSDYSSFLFTDNGGNPYWGGKFVGTADLNPGPSVLEFAGAGGDDIFFLHLRGIPATPPADAPAAGRGALVVAALCIIIVTAVAFRHRRV